MGRRNRWDRMWAPYVSVGERKANAEKAIKKMEKNGAKLSPISLSGTKIASSFWGKAWCSQIESFRDYESRLPRGRSYVRHGAVIDLKITNGEINALVQGSNIYKIKIHITKFASTKWQEIKKKCIGEISSVIELLQGKFSSNIMKTITDKDNGLFPKSSEIKLNCDCPDWATMCKHIAAVLYGVGARLDTEPELIFTLRDVDYNELLTNIEFAATSKSSGKSQIIEDQNLSDLFGIDIETSSSPVKKVAESKKVKSNAKPENVTKVKKKVTKSSKIAKENKNSESTQAKDFK